MNTKTNTVLITGGSSGIGLDAARGFLERGSNVVLNGRDESKLSKAVKYLNGNGNVATVAGDVGDKETGEKLVATAVEKFGSADVLVNNAGIFGLKPFLESTEEELDKYIRTNLKGTYFVTQAADRKSVV
jgi:NAD(P)-dependent dehydrogenase (short-subunit alcohol dehydrogenase family)